MATTTAPRVIPVKQRTPEWLDARQNGIGASQAAAAIGVSEWQSPVGLWAEKLGLVPPPAETLPMRIGSAIEPLIAALYTEATGVKVRRANLLRQHPTHDFMLASIDRRAGRRPVELKYSARGHGYGEPGTDEVPEDVLVQVLHQLAVMDEPEADVAAVIAGRPGIQIFTIVRHAGAEAAIVEREAVFWDHVQSRTEPPLDGSAATLDALAAIYPRDEGEVIEADETIDFDLVQIRDARIAIADWERLQAESRARVEAYMGTASKLVAAGIGEIRWKTNKDSVVTDWKALAGAYRELLDADSFDRARIDELLAEHTTTKPGARPFVPRFEEE